jgi:hypothetical protein
MTFRRSPQVRYRIVGNEAVVVRQDVAEVLVLNEVGGRVLELLDGLRTPAQICEVLRSEFEVEPARLERDLLIYLEELSQAGIIEATEGNP